MEAEASQPRKHDQSAVATRDGGSVLLLVT